MLKVIDEENLTVELNGEKFKIVNCGSFWVKGMCSDEEYNRYFDKGLAERVRKERCIQPFKTETDEAVAHRVLVLAPLDGGVDTIP